jgi:hypothetical protein
MADETTAASPNADVPADPWQMSPQQADKALAARGARFDAAQAASLEALRAGSDSEIELSRKLADRDWVRAFQRGSRVEQEDYARLTAAIATAADQDGTSILVGPAEVVPEGSVRRRDMISMIDHLSKIGLPEQGVVRALTGDFSDEDIEWAQRELDRGMATKEWADRLLSGDPEILHQWTAYCCILAARK